MDETHKYHVKFKKKKTNPNADTKEYILHDFIYKIQKLGRISSDGNQSNHYLWKGFWLAGSIRKVSG